MDGANRDEENNNESNGSSWWGSWPGWLQTAKEKSSNALEFMKRDLTEFTQVVQTDAVAAVSSTAAMLKEKLTIENMCCITVEVGAGSEHHSSPSTRPQSTLVTVRDKYECNYGF
ncbi:hypothetical protein AVEN_15215-1 [Araneus ventricosus]|uniref:Uncharacterized protein n=1 Tax=Araneus ventricosus TaxID=182803 RepID=A0A4Y2TN65_ARAVE|nr:hypothetical protein AVEN_15215-1 [Araneus ventricosus]